MNYEFTCLQRTALATNVATAFGKPLHEIPLSTFADGELNVVVPNPTQFKGKNIIFLQSTGQPVNELLLGSAFIAHELKNAGAATMCAVIPYLGYSRQERSIIPGKPGALAVIGRLFAAAGIDELITIELHNGDDARIFPLPIVNLSVQSLIAAHIEKQKLSREQISLIAPDKGIWGYVKAIAEQLGVGMMLFQKERFAPDQTRIVSSNGQARGTIGIIIDDIIATGGTALNVARLLPTYGYTAIYGYFIHPILAGNALEQLKQSGLKAVYATNTVPLSAAAETYIRSLDISSVIINELKKRMS